MGRSRNNARRLRLESDLVADFLDETTLQGMRDKLGLIWRPIANTTLVANASNVDFVIPAGISFVRAEIVIIPVNTGASNSVICLRTSPNGGIAYFADSFDYLDALIEASDNTFYAQPGTNRSFAQLTATVERTQTFQAPTIGLSMFLGNASARMQYRSVFSSYGGTFEEGVLRGQRNGNGAQDAIRFMTGAGDVRIGAGSRFILEGA